MSREEVLFKEKLFEQVKFDIELVINDNRSTMLNVLRRKRNFAKLSIHRMFLKAPDEVISAIAHYVKGTAKKKEEHLRIRSFIQSNLERLDYSSQNSLNCETSGLTYDLHPIYHELNKIYFDSKLDLKITWYGQRGRKNRSKIIFGQYFDHLRLIKIHRILDDPFFPSFFVHFVVYHEMLHHVIPGKTDHRGFFRTHGQAFKKREQEFALYEKAISWEKRNKESFFTE